VYGYGLEVSALRLLGEGPQGRGLLFEGGPPICA